MHVFQTAVCACINLQYDIWNMVAIFSSFHLPLSSNQSAVQWLFRSSDCGTFISKYDLTYGLLNYHKLPWIVSCPVCTVLISLVFISDVEFMDLYSLISLYNTISAMRFFVTKQEFSLCLEKSFIHTQSVLKSAAVVEGSVLNPVCSCM